MVSTLIHVKHHKLQESNMTSDHYKRYSIEEQEDEQYHGNAFSFGSGIFEFRSDPIIIESERCLLSCMFLYVVQVFSCDGLPVTKFSLNKSYKLNWERDYVSSSFRI